MEGITVGFALCGSFCTFKKAITELKKLTESDFNVIPIMSYNAFSTDTRFGKASDFINEIENICNNKIIATIKDAEPIGPKKMLDILVIEPCTGNTLAKIALGKLGVKTTTVDVENPIPNLKEELYKYDLILTHYGFTAFEAKAAGAKVILVATTKLHKTLAKSEGFICLEKKDFKNKKKLKNLKIKLANSFR